MPLKKEEPNSNSNNLAWSIDQYGRATIPGMDPPEPLDGRNLNWQTGPDGKTIIPGMEDPVPKQEEVNDLTFWSEGYDLEALRKSAGLDEEEGQRLYKLGAKSNPETYAKYLKILNEGYSSIESSDNLSKGSNSSYPSISINAETYKQFINKDAGVLRNCGLLNTAKQKSPAGANSYLEDLGRLGANIRLAGNMVSNGIVGAATAIPHWANDLLNKGGAALSKSLQKYTDAIMSNAWIKCLSSNVMGGIKQAVNFITSKIQNFLNKMFDLFKGLIALLMQATAMINALISGIQIFIRDRFLSGILGILISFICPLLKFFQKLISDLNFFASLMSNIDSTLFALSSMQSITNIGNTIMSKAMGGAGGLPKAGGKVVDLINNLHNIPQMFYGQLQKAMNVAQAIQYYSNGIADALMNQHGRGAVLTDIGPVHSSSFRGNWHRTYNSNSFAPPSFFPSLTRDPRGLAKYTKYGVPAFRRDGTSNCIRSLQDFKSNPFAKRASRSGGILSKDSSAFLIALRTPY